MGVLNPNSRGHAEAWKSISRIGYRQVADFSHSAGTAHATPLYSQPPHPTRKLWAKRQAPAPKVTMPAEIGTSTGWHERAPHHSQVLNPPPGWFGRHPQPNGWTINSPVHTRGIPSSKDGHMRTLGRTHRHTSSAFMAHTPGGPPAGYLSLHAAHVHQGDCLVQAVGHCHLPGPCPGPPWVVS